MEVTPLTDDQVLEAIEQMKSHCRNLELNDYHSVSARGVLNTLGYDEHDADQILEQIFNRGFTYCLDPRWHRPAADDRDKLGEHYISEGACSWGPDQLRSRLDCLR